MSAPGNLLVIDTPTFKTKSKKALINLSFGAGLVFLLAVFLYLSFFFLYNHFQTQYSQFIKIFVLGNVSLSYVGDVPHGVDNSSG